MCIMEFKLHSKYQPTGDQPQTIEKLVNSINAGNREQTLLGVTGSGKTFTMANVIQKVQRPTLVLAHNKTLAAQLCSEFKEFFPENAVEYFVSYYDYYQPEAYVAQTDTYIEKDSSINDEIDKLRHSATLALSESLSAALAPPVMFICLQFPAKGPLHRQQHPGAAGRKVQPALEIDGVALTPSASRMNSLPRCAAMKRWCRIWTCPSSIAATVF